MTSFSGLLLRWKASVYKIIWVELFAFLFVFFGLSFFYRYGLQTRESKAVFEEICQYAQTYRSTLPISFILGFYVTVIYNRWWSQFTAIPRPDAIAANVAAHIKGIDEESRLLRRTMVRYVNLAATLTYCAISTSVKKRFPTQEHLIRAGLLMEAEKQMLNSVRSEHPKYWIPCVWYINLLRKADTEKRISNAPGMKTLLDTRSFFRLANRSGQGCQSEEAPSLGVKHTTRSFFRLATRSGQGCQSEEAPSLGLKHTELNKFREKCDALYSYDWIEVPIVYTQVVTLAVYSYFVASLFSHQFLSDDSEYKHYYIDIYIPFTCLLELVFYIGWLKVAEKIMDPFGDDEHDFDMNVIVDRNWQLSYLTVDTMYDTSMALEKDIHYNRDSAVGLPHTKASLKMPVSKGSSPWLGSANHVRLTDKDMETVGGVQDEVGCCSCFSAPRRQDHSTADSSPLTNYQNGRAVSLNSIRPSSSTTHHDNDPVFEAPEPSTGRRSAPRMTAHHHRPQSVLT